MPMKISKELWIEEGLKFNSMRQIKIQNKCKERVYLVYTSYNEHLLFEIMESRYLTPRHKECYLVAVTQSKEKAIHYVSHLIDQIYNLKLKSYEIIKMS